MTLDHRKIEIIQEIAASTQEELIDAIDKVIKKFVRPTYKLDLSKHSNIAATVNIDKLKEERPLVDFDMAEFVKEADSLEWDKSIEELLEELD